MVPESLIHDFHEFDNFFVARDTWVIFCLDMRYNKVSNGVKLIISDTQIAQVVRNPKIIT